MSERFRTYLSYALVCTIWGSTWLVIKVGLETLTPFFAAGCRFILASAVLFVLVRLRNVPIPLGRSDVLFYLLVSLTSFSIPYGLVYWGEEHVSSGLTSILFTIYPFTGAFFSFLLIPATSVGPGKVAGIILGFVGIVVIFSNDVHLADPEGMWGMGAILCSAVLQGFSVVAVKKYGHSLHPFALTSVPMLLGGAMLLLFSVASENLSLNSFPPVALLSVLYLAIFGSIVTFVSYFWLLKRVEPVILSLTSFITPIIAVILGIVFLGEEFSMRTFTGAAFVLGGLGIANYADFKGAFGARR